MVKSLTNYSMQNVKTPPSFSLRQGLLDSVLLRTNEARSIALELLQGLPNITSPPDSPSTPERDKSEKIRKAACPPYRMYVGTSIYLLHAEVKIMNVSNVNKHEHVGISRKQKQKKNTSFFYPEMHLVHALGSFASISSLESGRGNQSSLVFRKGTVQGGLYLSTFTSRGEEVLIS